MMRISVHPSSNADSIELVDGCLHVRVKQSPDKNKANKAVLDLLKPLFGVCTIKSGHKSRYKSIIIDSMDLTGVKAILETL